ncbi:conjugative transfer region lipoprotein [Pseudomonas aeruginosa PA38182]|nr:conjugative transfer region lipoprotein [Pseudomonas aeruginosa PA38182]
MPRIWIDAAAVLLAATLLGGCATSKEKLLPHGDSTMLDIWHQETGGSPGGGQAARQLLDAGRRVGQRIVLVTRDVLQRDGQCPARW